MKTNWRADGSLLALAYVEYIGLPPGVPEGRVIVGGEIAHDKGKTQHVLDFEVFEVVVNTDNDVAASRAAQIEAAKAWHERIRVTQPWIARQ